MFLDSGAPTTPPRIISLIFRAPTTPPEQLTEHPPCRPWVAEMILENPRFWLILATQGECSVSCSGGVVEARKIREMMRGGAVGAPVSVNMLGMLGVMSL